jgi:hypothetical protein
MAIIVDSFTGQAQEGKGLSIELDYGARTDCQPVYIGFAEPGHTTADEVWKIMLLDYDAGPATGCLTRRRFALDTNDKATFSFAWDDRTSLTYG